MQLEFVKDLFLVNIAHRAEEITADVLEGTHSIVRQQAVNRLHAQKGIMAFLLAASAVPANETSLEMLAV